MKTETIALAHGLTAVLYLRDQPSPTDDQHQDDPLDLLTDAQRAALGFPTRAGDAA